MTIASKIAGEMDTLSPAERRVARSLLAQYPMAGLETMAKLSKRANVSDPTILRFIGKIGFKHYPDFQNALKFEINERIQRPSMVQPSEIVSSKEEEEDTYDLHARRLSNNITKTVSSLSRSEIIEISEIIQNSGSKIFIIAGGLTYSTAYHLYYHLSNIRDNVFFIVEPPISRATYLLNVSRRDVLFVFDIRRYQRDSYDFTKLFSKIGSKIILLTDQWLSPISQYASHVLPCKIASNSRWDSLVSMAAVIEILIFAHIEKNWDTLQGRLDKLDVLNDELFRDVITED